MSGVTTIIGTIWIFSQLSAQMPIAKPSRLNVTDVSTRKPIIQNGCWTSNGTNSRAVMRMMRAQDHRLGGRGAHVTQQAFR